MAAPMKHVFFAAKSILTKNACITSLLSCKLGAHNRIANHNLVNSARCQKNFHTTTKNYNLMEFFDEKDNWGKEDKVKVGRPWRKDELRLKSNSDLHKLWYVLLKERNMIMTMEEEYKRHHKLFPSPERMEKVEESMENLLDVVAERDRAVNLLETGRTGEPEPYLDKNILGIPHMRVPKEHYRPAHLNYTILHKNRMMGRWQNRYLVRLEEKKRRHQLWRENYVKNKKKKLKEIFPNAELDDE